MDLSTLRACLARMEVPDCPCWLAYLAMLEEGDTGPPPLCEHVKAACHKIPVAKWARILAQAYPDEYEPILHEPLPAGKICTLEGRIAVYIERVAGGFDLYRHDDIWRNLPILDRIQVGQEIQHGANGMKKRQAPLVARAPR